VVAQPFGIGGVAFASCCEAAERFARSPTIPALFFLALRFHRGYAPTRFVMRSSVPRCGSTL
jgi:hypothetical protein